MKMCLSARIVEQSVPHMPLSDFLRLARDCGYDGIGLRSWQIPAKPDKRELNHLALQVADSGLTACSITTDLERLPEAVAVARCLGTWVIQVGTNVGTLAAHLDQLDADMRIGPQMHTGGIYEQIASAAQDLTTVSDARIGVIVEPANLMLAGVRNWEKEIWQPIANRIIGCNIQSVKVGEGTSEVRLRNGSIMHYQRKLFSENNHADWPGFFASLREAGYDGFVNVTEPARDDMPITDLAWSCAAYLRQFIPVESEKDEAQP